MPGLTSSWLAQSNGKALEKRDVSHKSATTARIPCYSIIGGMAQIQCSSADQGCCSAKKRKLWKAAEGQINCLQVDVCQHSGR